METPLHPIPLLPHLRLMVPALPLAAADPAAVDLATSPMPKARVARARAGLRLAAAEGSLHEVNPSLASQGLASVLAPDT